MLLRKKVGILNKRAVSPVIGTLLMVNIALAMGVLYFSWAQMSLGRAYGEMQITYSRDIDQSKEVLVIEDARFLDRTLYSNISYELNITVRNIGPIDCKITALYLNTTDVSGNVDKPSIDNGFYHILVGDNNNSTRALVVFMFVNEPIPLEEGDVVNVKVVTEKGTRINAEWEISP